MLFYFAILLIPLVGLSGLAIDLGRVELRKMQLQLAADAGAMSAAAELQHNNSQWQTAATTEVTANAALNNFPVPSIGVQQGVSSGPYAADNSVVQVTLTQTVSTTLLQLLGSHSANLTVQGVAMIPPCIFFLGSPGNSSADVDIASAGLNNNSTCPVYAKDGFIVDGFAHICCATPKTPSSGSGVAGGGWTYPAIQYTSSPLADPLAYLASPVFSSCTPGLTGKNYTVNTTIMPGTYCGKLKVTGATVTMQPGLYIITGGATFSNATVNGSGVTLFFTQGGGSGFGTLSSSGSTLNLSAPTDASSGGIPGIVIFGDRAWSGGTQDFQFVGSTLYGDGVVYTTGTGIYDWQTNMSGPNYFNLVTSTMYLFGAGVNPSANYGPVTTGNPLRLAIRLVQ